MAYVHHSESPRISTDTVRMLAGLVDLTIPEEDLDAVASGLTDQLAAARVFEELDLEGVDPAVSFDPRWDE